MNEAGGWTRGGVRGRRRGGAELTGSTASPGPAAVQATAARILAFGRGRLAERSEFANIASTIGVAQYVEIAAEIHGRLGAGRILDWGAGWGQNALLLATHGLEVVAFDVEDKGAAAGLLAGTAVRYVVAADGLLPFADTEFDAALNCGVLEHVDDARGALAELRRVLRPGALLFTYHLPNRHAWTEWLGRRLGRFHHDRTYSGTEAVGLFQAGGFRVVEIRPFHVLPRNVWARLPERVATGPGAARALELLDAALVRLPGLRRLATAWALLAERR